MKLVLSIILSLLASCNYQNDPLVSNTGSLRNAPTIERRDFERSFERYLELFVVDNPAEEELDTLVRYRAMYELTFSETDEGDEYRELVSVIEDYFAGLNYLSLSNEEKKAHLINAYNFFVMDYMARNYPTVTNILEAPENVFQNVPFQFANQLVSLDHLEKNLLYQLMTYEAGSATNTVINLNQSAQVPLATKIDARFHFAVICGAKGCPILNPEMYYGDRLDQQLTKITKAGLRLKRNYDQSSGQLKLTQLFNWYQNDFNHHAENASDLRLNSYYEFLDLYSNTPALRVTPTWIPYNWERNGIDE